MNIMTGKSFRLALLLAAGVLALLVAVGTFSTQKAAAQQQVVQDVTVHPTSAGGGAVTPIRVGFELDGDGLIIAGQEITIAFAKGFGVPANIDASAIRIQSGLETSGRPANVTVDGNTVTVELGNDGDGVAMEIKEDGITDDVDAYITFTRAAGITAPISVGTYGIKVNGVPADDGADNQIDVSSTIKISPELGDPAATFTVAGTAFPDGTAKVYVGGSTTVTGDPGVSNLDPTSVNTANFTLIDGEVKVSGGKFSIDVPVGNDDGSRKTGFAFGTNHFHVVGDEVTTAAAVVHGAFTLHGTVEVTGGTDLLVGTKTVTIDLTQSSTVGGVTVGDVKIGDVSVPFVDATADDEAEPATPGMDFDLATDNVDDGAAKINIALPANIDLETGEQSLTVLDDDATTPATLGATTVTVSTLALELNPSTVVQGMTVTLTGSGFGAGSVDSLTIEDADPPAVAGTDAVGKGRYNFTFTVPDLPDGEAAVTLTHSNGIIGVGTLTLANPTIDSIDPAESRVDTSVSLAGSGFPANDLIDIQYEGTRVGSANTDGEGNWTTTILVPLTAEGTGDIVALRPLTETRGAERASDPVEHTVPAGETSYSADEGLSGDTITVSGEAYDPYTAVNIKIGGINVGSGVTDPNGDFSIPVEIPIFRPGSIQTLAVTLGEDDVVSTESIEILATPPEPESNAVTDVFAAEIASGNLIVAWRYDNDTETWSYFDPNLDEADNNYTIATAGDIVWLNLQAATTFQGKSLKGGWQLVTLQ